MSKVNIDSRYPEEAEVNRPDLPYQEFYEVISSVFDMQSVRSIIDVGCADGNLISIIKENNPHISVAGIEYFEYHKKYAKTNIADNIKFLDIRDDLPDDLKDQKFDIVICTEIAEHIEPEYTQKFLSNLKSLTGQLLIMTWSRHGGEKERHKDEHHQHLNPLELDQYLITVSNNGFQFNETATQYLHASAMNKNNFYFWWKESLAAWQPN